MDYKNIIKFYKNHWLQVIIKMTYALIKKQYTCVLLACELCDEYRLLYQVFFKRFPSYIAIQELPIGKCTPVDELLPTPSRQSWEGLVEIIAVHTCL